MVEPLLQTGMQPSKLTSAKVTDVEFPPRSRKELEPTSPRSPRDRESAGTAHSVRAEIAAREDTNIRARRRAAGFPVIKSLDAIRGRNQQRSGESRRKARVAFPGPQRDEPVELRREVNWEGRRRPKGSAAARLAEVDRASTCRSKGAGRRSS